MALRDEELLTADILQALPLDPARFRPGTMFRPLFDAARAALAQDRLIPAAAGGCRRPCEIRLGEGVDLRSLGTPDQHGVLCGPTGQGEIAHGLIPESATPRRFPYL